MKTCTYCGRENEETAAVCVECGSDDLRLPGSPPRRTSLKATLSKLSVDPTLLFRVLVLISLGSYVFGYFEVYLNPFLSSESRILLKYDGIGSIVTIPDRIFQMELVLFIASLAGLLGFLRPARLLYSWLIVAFAIQSLLTGPRVSTPIGSFTGYAGTLADGAILFMIYLTPLRRRFVR